MPDGAFAPSETFSPDRPTRISVRRRNKRWGRGECPVPPQYILPYFSGLHPGGELVCIQGLTVFEELEPALLLRFDFLLGAQEGLEDTIDLGVDGVAHGGVEVGLGVGTRFALAACRTLWISLTSGTRGAGRTRSRP